jgi:hypothetical protein
LATELPLFAYGTHPTGPRDPAVARLLLRTARRLGPARVRGRLHDRGGYPGLRLAADAGWVHGILLALARPRAALAQLDRYEDCHPAHPERGEYVREPVAVATQDGRTRLAWAYLLHPAIRRPGPPLRCGDWQRLGRRG